MQPDSLDIRRSASLTVSEVFKSIQGESTWAGMPCTFIRLTGCHLRCSYCDTSYAYAGGTDMTIESLLQQCHVLGVGLVEITGGEPLLQPACSDLASCLIEEGYTVLVETSGTLPLMDLPPAAIKIMDIKCPGSGMAEKNHWANLETLTQYDEIKFVIGDRDDYEWSREIVERHDLPSRCHQVLFSPVGGRLVPRTLVEWILEDRLNVRFQLQLHKYIWPEIERGV